MTGGHGIFYWENAGLRGLTPSGGPASGSLAGRN